MPKPDRTARQVANIINELGVLREELRGVQHDIRSMREEVRQLREETRIASAAVRRLDETVANVIDRLQALEAERSRD